jgi:hypothetical protein
VTSKAPWLRRALTLALVAAAAAFIAHTIVSNSRELAEFEWRVRPLVLAASVAAHTGVLAWGVFVWSRVLRGFGVRDAPFAPLLRVWALSNAARYIPGAIWQFVAAARLGAGSGLPQVVTLSSMIVHVLLSLATASTVAVLTLPLVGLGLPAWLAWTLRVAAPCAAVACVHPAAINLGLRLVPRALHRDVLSWHASWGEGLQVLALALASWLLYGAAYFLFLAALAPVPIARLPEAAGVNALSFVVSYVAVFAPGGLGVREPVMTVLLRLMLPVGVAAVVAVAARLWSVAAELLLVLVASLPRPARAVGAEGAQER